MTVVDTAALGYLAETEFPDLVADVVTPALNELRIFLHDGSFIDAWFSLKLDKRYSYHWERRAIDGTIYRHDNAPHAAWNGVATFPNHFHDGAEDVVVESHISNAPDAALREFLLFVRAKSRQMP